MANIIRDFFIGLSNNRLLNTQAKKWGFSLGADKFVAGTTVESVMEAVKELNQQGISCTLDNLGEFVSDKTEAGQAKDKIIRLLNTIHEENADCHLSVKLTQLGLDIDQDYCIGNMREILSTAKQHDIFVNIDMEDYAHYDETLEVLNALRKDYDHVGTVIQSYLYRAEDDLENLKDTRIRIVKGAYKESEEVAYPDKASIDHNFLELAKQRLKGDAFTSIGTHDHHIINELKAFVEENNIDNDKFEFQMLYGFRNDMQNKLANEGYNFCTYIPFGDDWFGYFMRRLAERPQNINLVLKDTFYTEDNKLKKGPVAVGGAVAAVSALAFWCVKSNRKKNDAEE
ncbi:MAG TPA: proline dehydrogenase family protein [Lentibacillus sp.]|uniref:proline dehydrogenase family protein n=1 Tax=Lentibacillus sp. TaxID=1925746 RepID=UPI002B4B7DF5|nr:proline dehydrogenase family protein [Lentibacillus sp.]HLR61050.1 proline dehydrogenase family protein [Lentibacillus sp.]